MSRDYITDRERFPPGSEPGTGYADVQMQENIDLQFGDSEVLKFGDAADVQISWDGSNLNVLPVADGVGEFRFGNGTLDMDIRIYLGTANDYILFKGSSDNNVQIVRSGLAVSGEEHALDITDAGVLASGTSLVGVNVVVSPTGTGGLWASAFYGKVVVAGNALPGTGYCSGAELEVQYNAGITPSDMFILSMNSSNNATMSPNSAYFIMHEYGSAPMRNLMWLRETTRASASDTVIVSQVGTVAGRSPYDTAVKCKVGTGGTTFWLMGSTVGPATIADFKVPGSVAANYVEWDASADRLNVVVATRTITGEEHAVDVSHAGVLSAGESIVGCNVAVAPTGTGGLWASAFFGKVTIVGNSLPGTGYVSGAEFEVNYSAGITPSDMWILSLNAGNAASMSPNSAFIAVHQYGSALMRNFFCAPQDTIGAYDSGKMVCTTNSATITHGVQVRVGSTTLWLLATSSLVAP